MGPNERDMQKWNTGTTRYECAGILEITVGGRKRKVSENEGQSPNYLAKHVFSMSASNQSSTKARDIHFPPKRESVGNLVGTTTVKHRRETMLERMVRCRCVRVMAKSDRRMSKRES